MMYADGGPDVEYGQTRAEEKETFSEKEYASDDPNDDENGYTGDYNTADTDHPEGEDEEEANEGAEHDGDVEPEAFLQVKTKDAYKKKKKKGWGNLMDSDGGDEVEYGQQTVAEQNDFSEKQYESNDPNDDENGYDGDYNTPDTDHPDGEAEEEEDKKEGDDDNEDSFIQARSKTQTKHASKKKRQEAATSFLQVERRTFVLPWSRGKPPLVSGGPRLVAPPGGRARAQN